MAEGEQSSTKQVITDVHAEVSEGEFAPPADSVFPEPNLKAPRKPWLRFLFGLKASDYLAILALGLSLYATRLSWQSSLDTATSEEIKNAYDTFYDINRLELANSDVSHMFALPENYDYVSAQLAQVTPHPSSAQRAQVALKERAVALALFTIFERNLYEYNEAVSSHDNTRADFLKQVLDYFTGRLLRNPRLVYYWKLTPGGVATYFERSTRKYYEDNADFSRIDTNGPFGEIESPSIPRKTEKGVKH